MSKQAKVTFAMAFSVGAVLFSSHAGGGKAIDTCKVLAHTTERPFFTFPTIASTCASCTSLGILYHPDGSLREYSFSKIPPNHIFIDTQIIAEAPDIYLWAGMGDTMAKHYECTVSSRGHTPAHSDAMGIALSPMCAAPIQRWGKQALEDCRAHRVTDELTEVILGIIVSTGFVSNFVQVDYTTGMAHADPSMLEPLTAKALAGIDLRVWPYPVDAQMLTHGILELEEYNKTH